MTVGQLWAHLTEHWPRGPHVAAGRRFVADLDLEKVFDRVNHDVLMARVARKVADKRVMASLTRFLGERSRLSVNVAKSAVDRPWTRSFLGYGMTHHQKPRLTVPASSVKRFKATLSAIFRAGRGRVLVATVDDLTPILRGWTAYFRFAAVKGVFEALDRWLRRKLLCIRRRQWKRRWPRAQRLMQRGLDRHRAWLAANNGRGPWWNAGASHMNDAYRKAFFDDLGLISILREHQRRSHAP